MDPDGTAPSRRRPSGQRLPPPGAGGPVNRQARPSTRAEAPAPEPAPQPPAIPNLPPPSVTRDEIDLLIRRAGLTLNAGQKADLAVSFQHLVTLAAKLPRARPLSDEPAFVFHPPMSARAAPEAGKPPPAARAKAAPKPAPRPKPKAKPATKPPTKLGAKAKPVATKVTRKATSKAAKPAPRKPAKPAAPARRR